MPLSMVNRRLSAISGLSATFVGCHPYIPEIDDGLMSYLDKCDQAAVSQQENIFEDAVRQSEVFGAVAVVPSHIGEI